MVVRGPAGIGKTRLLAEARRVAESEGITLLTARGSELERDYAFGGVRQLLEPLVNARAGDHQLFAGEAAHAASVFAPQRTTQREPREAILYGLYWLLIGLASEQPLALLVDDAHWLDAPSLRWLIFALNRVVGTPVAMIVATRPFDPQTDQRLLDGLCAHPAAQHLTPQPLSAQAVGAVAQARLHREPDDELVETLARTTAGNPFYVHELLGSLAAPAPSGPGPETLDPAATPTVAEAVARRLGGLSRSAIAVGQAVAVCGSKWGPALPAQMAGLDHKTALVAIEELIRADLLAADGLEFSHPLVRDVVYRRMPALERDRLHRAAAQALIHRGATDEQVAGHLLASDPREDEEARGRLICAADEAWSRGAPEVAATFRARALQEGAVGSERIRLLRDLGQAEVAARGPAGLPHLRRALEEATDRRQRGEILLDVGRALSAHGDHGGAVEVFNDALNELDGQEPDLIEELEDRLALLACLVLAQFEKVGGHAGLISSVDSQRAPRPLARLARSWSLVVSTPPASKGAAEVEELLAEDLPFADETALGVASLALVAAGQPQRARAMWEPAVSAMRLHGALAQWRGAMAFRGQALLRMGRLDEAEADVRALEHQVVEWMSTSDFELPDVRMGSAWVMGALAEVLIDKGELDEAQGWIELSAVEAEMPQLQSFSHMAYALGLLRAAQGRTEDAVGLLRECGRRQTAWGIDNPGSIPWRSALAAHVDSLDEAVELCDEQITLSEQFGVGRELGMSLRVKGVRLGGPAGLDLLRRALDVLDVDAHPVERARALIDLGELLHEQADLEGARETLRSGMDLAARCGASAIVARGNGLLVATGARPRRKAVAGVEALTASELRTARLAVDHTNRQIAETLFVTEKTVEAHLRQAYRKLQITSRSQLPEALGAEAQV